MNAKEELISKINEMVDLVKDDSFWNHLTKEQQELLAEKAKYIYECILARKYPSIELTDPFYRDSLENGVELADEEDDE